MKDNFRQAFRTNEPFPGPVIFPTSLIEVITFSRGIIPKDVEGPGDIFRALARLSRAVFGPKLGISVICLGPKGRRGSLWG